MSLIESSRRQTTVSAFEESRSANTEELECNSFSVSIISSSVFRTSAGDTWEMLLCDELKLESFDFRNLYFELCAEWAVVCIDSKRLS